LKTLQETTVQKVITLSLKFDFRRGRRR